MISGFLELLQKRYRGQLDDKADEYIFYAVDGAKRMKTMVTDLLELSRVATRGQVLQPCELGQCVRQAVDSLRLKIEESNALVEVGELPTVLGDVTQLSQLFQNLIDNSIKYRSGEAPKIEIACTHSADGMLCVDVVDNGIGLPEEYSERAFLVFQRLHADRSIEGSGIGLAVCKKIVERHGGTISARRHERGGTRLSFTLQAASAAGDQGDRGRQR